MSKVKTPGAKKALSLKRDRRNAYGENAKSSRKNIPLGRQLAHQAERQVVRRTLARAANATNDDERVELETKAEVDARLQRLRGFRKCPDQPLGQAIERKLRRRGVLAAPSRTPKR